VKRGTPKGLRVLAEHVSIEVEFLRECVEHGALPAAELTEDPGTLSPAALARLRRLRRLCRDLDLDVFAGSIIVELLEQLEALRRDRDRPRRGDPDER